MSDLARRYPPRKDGPGPLHKPGPKPKTERKWMPKVNKARKARLKAEQEGPQARMCRLSPCCVPTCTKLPPTEAAHYVSRGAGGKSSECVPLCANHHREQHDHGIKTFQATHNVILEVVAGRYAEAVKAHECYEWPELGPKGFRCAVCHEAISRDDVTP